MPIYEYKCDNCGKIFEVIQKISDIKLPRCTSCKTGNVRRILSSSGFRLKGSGWYETDFKTKKPSSKSKDK